MYADIECPYCNHPQDIDHADGYGYEEDEKHTQECPGCERTFVFETSVSYYYETSQADCLNEADHNYKLSHTFPLCMSSMICALCGKERELTEDERISNDIETEEEYIRRFKKEKFN